METKEEHRQQYQQTVANIKKFFEWDLALRGVFGSRIDLVKGVFELIQRQMNELDEDKKVEVTGEEKSRVKEVANLFSSIAVNNPILPIFRDLASSYLLLVFNWNKELGKRDDIANSVNVTLNIVMDQMTRTESIAVLKVLIANAKKMAEYNPRSFELSRAYLETLNKDKK